MTTVERRVRATRLLARVHVLPCRSIYVDASLTERPSRKSVRERLRASGFIISNHGPHGTHGKESLMSCALTSVCSVCSVVPNSVLWWIVEQCMTPTGGAGFIFAYHRIHGTHGKESLISCALTSVCSVCSVVPKSVRCWIVEQ